MTENDHSSAAGECGMDVAPYALGTLDPGEAEVFRAHLESCAVCRDELEAFEAVIAEMPLSAPAYQAPRELRARVMDAVAREPRLKTDSREPRRARQAMPRVVIARPGLALGVSLLLAVLVFGGVELGSSGGPQTHVYQAQVTGSGQAEITLSSSGARLIVRHFPPPPRGHVYEVWLKRPGRAPAPTDALFSVRSNGSGEVDVPGDLHGVSTVLVTPEPDGGSPHPTHTPVISVQLS